MIFVLDDDFNVACGNNLNEAYKKYQDNCRMNATASLRVFEGKEMVVDYNLTPKKSTPRQKRTK